MRSDEGENLEQEALERLAVKVAEHLGAASGMGTAAARIFARKGARVVVAELLEAEGRKPGQVRRVR